jgi:hypothetical protein
MTFLVLYIFLVLLLHLLSWSLEAKPVIKLAKWYMKAKNKSVFLTDIVSL